MRWPRGLGEGRLLHPCESGCGRRHSSHISTGLSQHKFGIDIAEAPAVYERASQYRNLTAEGVSAHIGSQIWTSADAGRRKERCSRWPQAAARATRSGILTWAAASAWPINAASARPKSAP